MPFIRFRAFLRVVIHIFFILNSGGGSCLFSSHVFSPAAGSIVASVVVLCLRVVTLFLKYLLKIVAIFSEY